MGRSSFYAWLAAAEPRAARRAADQALVHEITVIHVGSRQSYGVPRVHAELRRLGRRVNRKRVARLREHGIQGATRRRRRSLTRPDKKARPAPDLIGRDSTPRFPEPSWSATSPPCPPVRAGSTSPAVWTWPPRSLAPDEWSVAELSHALRMPTASLYNQIYRDNRQG
ncbi:MAG: transposase [Streptomyces sp.]|nr:transposase [Streptomyces sp.]